MNITAEQFTELMERYRANTISPEEWDLLRKALPAVAYKEMLEEDMIKVFETLQVNPVWGRERESSTWTAIHKQINTGATNTVATAAHRTHFLKTAWFRYAAIVILLFGVSASFYYTNQNRSRLMATVKPVTIKKDILPGGNRATLTLADGSIITLDSTANGPLAHEGNTRILKLDAGSLAYQAVNSHAQVAGAEVQYNTISTPKGGQYRIVLSDGSKVWLNAASSLRFPAGFSGKDRSVDVSGEAYFEIAKDKEKPFIVKTNKEQITVLGTSFNVNSYSDDSANKISLLEGAVQVDHRMLRPGQAFINGKVISTNLTQDLAWKNGIFSFSGANLAEVMRQISRWYDVKADYPPDLAGKEFEGEMGRDLSLLQMLKLLDGPDMHFRLEGRKIIVHP